MPAQTHGRVRNGFHIQATSAAILRNYNKSPCNNNSNCYKGFCCGKSIQPEGIRPRPCRRGLCSFTPNRGHKRSLALGGIGPRSARIKRAISRRVENRNRMPLGYVPSATRPPASDLNGSWPTAGAICHNSQCPCCLITVTKNHPRNVCLGSCKR